jgi:hypothetical protein
MLEHTDVSISSLVMLVARPITGVYCYSEERSNAQNLR